MKFLKALLILLLVVIAIGTILMLMLPVKQKVERSIIINARPAVVYDYLSKLSNFPKWSAWDKNDPTIINTITGTDGTPGAVNSWKGDPELSGEGKIQITSLEINQEIEHAITFIAPRTMEATSEFDIQEVNGQTKLTWKFERSTPRPWNIFNAFSSIETKMGRDFDEGLKNLKELLEKSTPSAKDREYDVLPMNFPSTSFATRRQMLGWNEMLPFLDTHLPQLYEACLKAKATPGSPSCLFYVWDEQNKQADIAAAVPVSQGTSFTDTTIHVVDLPASKAVYVNYYGAYDKSAPAYASIDKYCAANNLKQKAPAIEQYITDPKLEKDTSKWLTIIIFLVE